MLSLACNMPLSQSSQADIEANQLRQTLAAQPVLTQTAIVAQENPGQPVDTSSPSVTAWPGLVTAIPGAPGPGPAGASGSLTYTYAQSGDTLAAVASHFGVKPEEISSQHPLSPSGYLTPGQELSLPSRLGEVPYPWAVLPDSEVVFSPSAGDFDVGGFVTGTNGYLKSYTEEIEGKTLSGSQIVEKIARESSVNPRFLLAFLEYRSGWVFGQPDDPKKLEWPIGFRVPGLSGLYQELAMTATHLNAGYYGWRDGSLTELEFSDGSLARLSPHLNAGSVAVQHLFSKFYAPELWESALYGADSFPMRYQVWFGDPWDRAATVEPLISPGLSQPILELPFRPGERWSLTGGPHFSWNTGSPRGALDFSPVTDEPVCAVSKAWATAAAPGLVARSDHNVLALDLDGDGNEGTGWVLVYVHLAEAERAPLGSLVVLDDRLGHPSCERGRSTGKHFHIARKFNGEWIPADGPLPFVLGGWRAKSGLNNYQGELVKGDQVVTANPGGTRTSSIIR
jgi:hypothetical protein